MKKSQFKALIKEAMLEILPDLMEVMVKGMNENYVPQTVNQTADLSLIRQQVAANRVDESAPNEKAIVEGEVYASGKGIMEWFGDQNVKPTLSEFKHSPDQMDDYISKRFGIK